MYRIVSKRNLLLNRNKYLVPGEYIITRWGDPVLEIKIKAISKWPEEKIITDGGDTATLDKGGTI